MDGQTAIREDVLSIDSDSSVRGEENNDLSDVLRFDHTLDQQIFKILIVPSRLLQVVAGHRGQNIARRNCINRIFCFHKETANSRVIATNAPLATL